MRILVAGGTGFIGRSLIAALIKQEHNVTVLGRNIQKINAIFSDQVHALKWDELENFSPDNIDAVINLAGRNIGAGRWTKLVKAEIINSRIEATRQLSRWCASAAYKPHLYSASAIGIYGLQPLLDHLPHRLTESSHIGDGSDFVSEVGIKWEQALQPALEAHVPVTILRFAVVLKKNEGVLKKMQPSFYFGLGGKLGSGTQPFCWVHIDDVVESILFLLQHNEMTGIFNIAAPECVMQKDFATILARCMKRPCFMTTPGLLMEIVFGQMARELLLQGQHVYPKRLIDSGYAFKYAKLGEALENEFS